MDNILTFNELNLFKELAEQTDKIPKKELAKTAPILTTRTYLEMCRVAYDASPRWEKYKELSNEALFCKARMFSLQHEYDHGILGIDWDSPEQFYSKCWFSYHFEEMEFGGPKLYIHNTGEETDKYVKWIGVFYNMGYDEKRMSNCIRQYIALRQKGYPIYFPEYKELYECIKEKLGETKIYKPLELDCVLPIILQENIEAFIKDLNENNGLLADCYEQEIRSILNGCEEDLCEEQINVLRRYYCKGGIYITL